MHSGRGWSPGLFLDQRANRDWVQENSHDKDVLNLFCYTAGFSVAAALGGARSVTSVDTSKQTLEWAKENFALNEIDLNSHQFWALDAREFLQMAERQGRRYDLIICDPPSFARSKKSIFRIEKEFRPLVEQMGRLLKPEGKILFSTNYERWNYQALIKQLPKGFIGSPAPSPVGDHDLPGEEPAMKSVFVRHI
jgi:23S rRNA (cytosine1962-C5)-methyltransferase